MLDLDIGMNDWLIPPLEWDPARTYDRGKVMTAEEPQRQGSKSSAAISMSTGMAFPTARCLGTHPPRRGAFFTRGTSKDRYARYSEEGHDYVDNMQRLLHKFDTVQAAVVPQPEKRSRGARGPPSSACSLLRFDHRGDGKRLSRPWKRAASISMRCAFAAFRSPTRCGNSSPTMNGSSSSSRNRRDAQMRTLLTTELEIDPARLVPILHYDGTPITARFIVKAIADMVSVVTLAPLRKVRS